VPFEPHQPPIEALESLSIRDFRGIESLDLDFRGPDGLPNRLVVIAGPNGCGKTSVLEAARFAVDGAYSKHSSTANKMIRRGAEEFYISGYIQTRGAETIRSYFHITSVNFGFSLNIQNWYFPSWRVPGLGGAVDVSMGRTKLNSKRTDQNRLRKAKQRLVHAAAVERFNGGDPDTNNHYSRWIGVINESWREFDPSHEASFSVELTKSVEPDGGNFNVYYRRLEAPRLEVDFLSSGQIELFVFITTLVFNEDREGIVFIDEPELHLDPQWHRPLIRSLMRLQPKAQFIVTTHSPEIYDAARSYERHFLVPDDDPRAQLWRKVRPSPSEA